MEKDPSSTDDRQAQVTRRYDRMAWLYDLYDAPMEWFGGVRRLRRDLVSRARGHVLEVGVGTGRNLEFYPSDADVTAIDVAPRMMARARRRARTSGRPVRFVEADVQHLPFPDDSFDTTVATAVFCSVADPVAGLKELKRVTRPEGQILLLEHVRPRTPILGLLADAITPITRRLFGFRANRRTEDNVVAAGIEPKRIIRKGVWREIIADPGKAPTPTE